MKFFGILLYLGMGFNLITAQVLYKNFEFEMSLEKATEILQENSKTLKNISFGKGTSYAFRKRSLVDHEGSLVSINIWSKKNLSLAQATEYLKLGSSNCFALSDLDSFIK